MDKHGRLRASIEGTLFASPKDWMNRLTARRRVLGRTAHVRAFTLIELMVVVMIIAILSAIAVPSMLGARKDRYGFNAANDINALLRLGRARAMGRGAAVLFEAHIDGGTTNRGTFTLREDADSTGAPGTGGCKGTAWGSASVIGQLDLNVNTYIDSGVQSDGKPNALGASPGKDIYLCFAPSGRVFAVQDNAITVAAIAGAQSMTTPISIRVVRKDAASAQVGPTRQIIISPSGVSRVSSKAGS